MRSILLTIARHIKACLPFAMVTQKQNSFLSSVLTFPTIMAAYEAGHKLIFVGEGVYTCYIANYVRDITIISSPAARYETRVNVDPISGYSGLYSPANIDNMSEIFIFGGTFASKPGGADTYNSMVFQPNSGRVRVIGTHFPYSDTTSCRILDGSGGNYGGSHFNLLLGNTFTSTDMLGSPLYGLSVESSRNAVVGNVMQSIYVQGTSSQAGNNLFVGNYMNTMNMQTPAANGGYHSLVCANIGYGTINDPGGGGDHTWVHNYITSPSRTT